MSRSSPLGLGTNSAFRSGLACRLKPLVIERMMWGRSSVEYSTLTYRPQGRAPELKWLSLCSSSPCAPGCGPTIKEAPCAESSPHPGPPNWRTPRWPEPTRAERSKRSSAVAATRSSPSQERHARRVEDRAVPAAVDFEVVDPAAGKKKRETFVAQISSCSAMKSQRSTGRSWALTASPTSAWIRAFRPERRRWPSSPNDCHPSPPRSSPCRSSSLLAHRSIPSATTRACWSPIATPSCSMPGLSESGRIASPQSPHRDHDCERPTSIPRLASVPEISQDDPGA